MYLNNDLRNRLSVKIDGVRTELKADIAEVRTELKADIDSLKAHIDNVQETLEADIQRLDDRYFSLLIPQLPEAADESGETEASS